MADKTTDLSDRKIRTRASMPILSRQPVNEDRSAGPNFKGGRPRQTLNKSMSSSDIGEQPEPAGGEKPMTSRVE